MPASISVIMPVYNGADLLDRAIRSVLRQTYADWEVLAVDDNSSDGSFAALQAWACKDSRIRALRLSENSGPSVARNAALREAGGQIITYLDHDDEYFPDYLELVMRHRNEGQVLVFGYDIVYRTESLNPTGERIESWDPRWGSENFFVANPVVPLGVAHYRNILDKVGGLNELIWCEEDWDMWKRLARAGATFVFLPLKSGRYYVRSNSLIRVPHLTARQRETVLENWEAGKPIFAMGQGELESSEKAKQGGPQLEPLKQVSPDGGTRKLGPPYVSAQPTVRPPLGGKETDLTNPTCRRLQKRKVMFVSPHCIVDYGSDAAKATRNGLWLLGELGFDCQAFCGTRLAEPEERSIRETLAKRGMSYEVCPAKIGRREAYLLSMNDGRVRVTLLENAGTRGDLPSEEETEAFLTACDFFLRRHRPDVVWTYGSDPASRAAAFLAKRHDIPVLFGVHDLACLEPDAFRNADYAVVPSEFARRKYWQSLGVACQRLPFVLDPAHALVGEGNNVSGTLRVPMTIGTRPASGCPVPDTELVGTVARYVTFVDPQPANGLYVFARIAEQLASRRPDISLCFVAARSHAGWQHVTGIDLHKLPNVTVSWSAYDPREYYAATQLLLMPTLGNEAFNLLAAEAMLNGIPVLASNRGALPEVIGDAGFLFDIPTRYMPDTRDVPTAEEVEPWVETIIRLWDDAAEYERWSLAARERAQQWHPQRLAPIYREFFGSITHQPGPPIVPKNLI